MPCCSRVVANHWHAWDARVALEYAVQAEEDIDGKPLRIQPMPPYEAEEKRAVHGPTLSWGTTEGQSFWCGGVSGICGGGADGDGGDDKKGAAVPLALHYVLAVFTALYLLSCA